MRCCTLSNVYICIAPALPGTHLSFFFSILTFIFYFGQKLLQLVPTFISLYIIISIFIKMICLYNKAFSFPLSFPVLYLRRNYFFVDSTIGLFFVSFSACCFWLKLLYCLHLNVHCVEISTFVCSRATDWALRKKVKKRRCKNRRVTNTNERNYKKNWFWYRKCFKLKCLWNSKFASFSPLSSGSFRSIRLLSSFRFFRSPQVGENFV